MSLHRPHTRVLLLVALALTPCAAKADPVGFSYSWSIAGGDVSASGPGPISLSQSVASNGSSVTTNYGSGFTTVTVAAGGTASTTPGGADFFSATPAALPLATLTTPAFPGPVGGIFTFSANNPFTLQLTDTASGQSGTLTLSGNTYGNLSKVGSTFGLSASGDPSQSVLLGGHRYSVDAVNSVADSGPGGDPASYFARVYIDRPAVVFFPPIFEGNGGVASVPEPSSLLLAGSALSLLGGAALRKRRRVRAA